MGVLLPEGIRDCCVEERENVQLCYLSEEGIKNPLICTESIRVFSACVKRAEDEILND